MDATKWTVSEKTGTWRNVFFSIIFGCGQEGERQSVPFPHGAWLSQKEMEPLCHQEPRGPGPPCHRPPAPSLARTTSLRPTRATMSSSQGQRFPEFCVWQTTPFFLQLNGEQEPGNAKAHVSVQRLIPGKQSPDLLTVSQCTGKGTLCSVSPRKGAQDVLGCANSPITELMPSGLGL